MTAANQASARAATCNPTGGPPMATATLVAPLPATQRNGRRGAESGSSGGGSESASQSQISKRSGERASGSKKQSRRWRQPKTVREFAAQANAVATMLLNGEIDLDKAKA